MAARFDEPTRRDLLQTIQEEAERLNRFVGNLLDMTKLEAGALQLNRDWIELGEVVGTALGRVRSQMKDRVVKLDDRAGPAAAARRFRAVRAGAVQPARQCREIFAAGGRIEVEARREAARSRSSCATRGRASRWPISSGSSTSSTASGRRPPDRRHRPRPVDLPRHRRGPWRHDRRPQPARRQLELRLHRAQPAAAAELPHMTGHARPRPGGR